MMMPNEGGSAGIMSGCGCPHHKMVPLLVFIIGLLFFLNAVNVVTSSAVTMLWPIGLMLIGLMKMMSGKCKCCGNKCM